MLLNDFSISKTNNKDLRERERELNSEVLYMNVDLNMLA
jgi:hypothetical protein